MATNLNALVLRIGADTSSLQAGVRLTRRELGTVRSSMRMARTNADELRDRTAALAKAHRAGAITTAEYNKSIAAVGQKYGPAATASQRLARTSRMTSDTMRQQRMILAQSIPGVNRLTNSFAGLNPPMIAASAGIGVLVGGVYASIRAFKSLSGHVAASMTEIDNVAKASSKLGLMTDDLVGLRLAASEFSGMASGQFDTALQRMTRRIAEASQGSGEAQGAIRELGLDATKLAAAGPAEAFRQISSAMQNVKGESQRLRIAFKLFDSEGAGLVSTLSAGRNQIEGVEAAARQMGIAFTNVESSRVEAANDAMGRIGMSVKGVSNDLAILLAPTIETVANDIQSWINTMRSAKTSMDEASIRVATFAGGLLDYAQILRGVAKVSGGDITGGSALLAEGVNRTNALRMQAEATQSVADSYARAAEARKRMAAGGVGATIESDVARIEKMEQEASSINAMFRDASTVLRDRQNVLNELRSSDRITADAFRGSTAKAVGEFESSIGKLSTSRAIGELREALRGSLINPRDAERMALSLQDGLKKLDISASMKSQLSRQLGTFEIDPEANRLKSLREQFEPAADSIRKSLNTPFDDFVDKLTNADLALQLGMITPGEATQSRTAARRDFQGRNDKPMRVELPPTLQRGTAEEYKLITSIAAGKREKEAQRHREAMQTRKANQRANERMAELIEGLDTVVGHSSSG